MENIELKLATMAAMFADENKAREWLESKLWPSGPVCPNCACVEIYNLAKTRAGLYKCKACKRQFTVRIGTMMEESKIPICKWLKAIHLMTSSKKGVSSHQIARECGITQKSSWFMNHRIREAMKQLPMTGSVFDRVESSPPLPEHGMASPSDALKTLEVLLKERVLEFRFKTLASAWKNETKFLSNVAKKSMHPAYQGIIGMGEPAIKFIMKDLLDNGPNHWFWALTAITNENPLTEEIAGNMASMTEAWLKWGKKAGYLKDCPKTS